MSNPLHSYGSDNADVDLATGATIYTESNAGSVPRYVVLNVLIGDGTKDLAAGADTVLTFQLSNGGILADEITRTIPSGQDRARFQTDPIVWINGETLALTCSSDQAGDTDVDVTVTAYDVAPLQPVTSGLTAAVDANGVFDAQVKGVDADAINSAAIADDAVTGNKFAASAVLKIWSQLTAGLSAIADSVGKLIVDNLDAQVSTRSTFDHQTDEVTTDGPSRTASKATGFSTHSAADVWAVVERSLTDKAGFSLTSAERSAIAVVVEAAIMNEGDSQAVIAAIVAAIDAADIDLVTASAIAAEVKAQLEAAHGAGSWESADLSGIATTTQLNARTLVAAEYATAANQTTILNRLGSFLGTGVDTVLGFLLAIMGKTATNPANVPTGYTAANHSNQTIRERVDATAGGGGSTSLVVAPVAGTIPERSRKSILKLYVGEIRDNQIGIVDESMNPVDLAARILKIVIDSPKTGVDVQVILDDDIVISGDDFNTINFTNAPEVTATATEWRWSLWDVTNAPTKAEVLTTGLIQVEKVAGPGL